MSKKLPNTGSRAATAPVAPGPPTAAPATDAPPTLGRSPGRVIVSSRKRCREASAPWRFS